MPDLLTLGLVAGAVLVAISYAVWEITKKWRTAQAEIAEALADARRTYESASHRDARAKIGSPR